jgi:CheY-like chemotaxis protein
MKNNNPILIVEDDADDCEFILSALNELGVKNEKKCFSNGKDALAYLKSSHLETFVILSDVNMPLLNGLQLKAEINQDDYLRRKSIPFVFLSTSTSKKEVEAAYDLMAQGYFKKPNSFDEIKTMLKMVTDYWDTANHPG